ncbi:S-adenosyl-L-methionine-dependent methyltransferase [Amylocystis lapponica]|nr:S-adenosyl-L-methionine-dependent methyltransferase [Amylocystis lapponica]
MSDTRARLHSDSAVADHSLHRPDKKPRLDSAIPLSDAEVPPSDLQPPNPVDSHEPSSTVPTPPAKKNTRKRKAQKHVLPEPYSSEDVVSRDALALLGSAVVEDALSARTEWDAPFEHKEEIEFVVSCLSSTGESLSLAPSPRRPWVVVTPLALPGETIRVRVYRHSRLHSYADLLEVITPNPEWRDMSRVKCKYFARCGGCQYQMLSYDTQLDLKRNVVVKAYQNFSDLPSSAVPEILTTIPSPLQYGYRTKITPHFDAPPKKAQKAHREESANASQPEWLNIGFNQIGTRQVLDIEECPIATPTLNEALRPLRADIIKNIYSYKKGVSLLLRDSLEIPRSSSQSSSSQPADAVASPQEASASTPTATPEHQPVSAEKHNCITNHKHTVRERVGDKIFEYTAGSFFQNNNSVLEPLTSYVRDAIFPTPFPSSSTRPTHLVDAYCGSGLFALTLAPSFTRVAGIELSADSIRSAKHNAVLNGFAPEQCTFLAGDAADIFATVQDFPREQTALIIDPPRKGTDERFVEQLLRFGCETVVYVSCNVHTQARDVGMILRKSEAMGGRTYALETLRGFDLFPQTAHVESVAVLRLV